MAQSAKNSLNECDWQKFSRLRRASLGACGRLNSNGKSLFAVRPDTLTVDRAAGLEQPDATDEERGCDSESRIAAAAERSEQHIGCTRPPAATCSHTNAQSSSSCARGRPAPWMAFTAREILLLESTATLCMNGAPTAQLAVSELSAIDALCGGRQGDAVQSELQYGCK